MSIVKRNKKNIQDYNWRGEAGKKYNVSFVEIPTGILYMCEHLKKIHTEGEV